MAAVEAQSLNVDLPSIEEVSVLLAFVIAVLDRIITLSRRRRKRRKSRSRRPQAPMDSKSGEAGGGDSNTNE